jgi:GH35 family endo-1,4-beta-xylanase
MVFIGTLVLTAQIARLPISLMLILTLLPALLHAAPNSPTLGDLPPPTGIVGTIRDIGLDKAEATVRAVLVHGQPFTGARRFQSSKRPDQPWSTQWVMPLTAPVRKGDVLRLRTTVRGGGNVPPRGADIEFVFETAAEPYDKSLERPFEIGADWQPIDLSFVCARDYPVGGANLLVRLGYDPQWVEMGPVALDNLGKVDPTTLPKPAITYAGREPDAPWRKHAGERIDRIRKSNLVVKVVDADGNPVPDASVRVRMTRHRFAFGSAVVARTIVADTEDARRYRQVIEECFNRVVFENDLKWPHWDRKNVPPAIEWLRARGISIRGHCLVWPSWENSPRDLISLKDRPDELRKRVADHITEIVSTYRGKLVDWDVINEIRTNRDLLDVLGDDVAADWFRLARDADPDARLWINDYDILSGGGRNTRAQDDYENAIRRLLDAKAPLDGIGLQGHFGARLTPPDRLLEVLDRFASLGPSLQVTEFDISIDDEQCQADYTRDFMTVLFSHPAVEGIVMWGFWEKHHWRPKAALYRADWTIKPNGQAWRDLVLKEWWTDETVRTNAVGEATVRGFHGDYEISVESTRGHAHARISLSVGDVQTTVRLER